MYKKHLKRVIDFLVSFIALIILSPLLLIISLCIIIDSKGPILFKQKRVGKKKKLFNILKFRTMKIDTPHNMPTHLLERPEQYITRVGKFLRKSSLDELPQLINILKGQMAIVGPRPALWNQDDLIADRDIYGANDVLPGLTGLAQVTGRDSLEISDKAKLDGDYVKEILFKKDLLLIILTLKKVVSGDGIVEGATEKKHNK